MSEAGLPSALISLWLAEGNFDSGTFIEPRFVVCEFDGLGRTALSNPNISRDLFDATIGNADILIDAQPRAVFECLTRLEDDVTMFVKQSAGKVLELVVPISGSAVESVFNIEAPTLCPLLARV